MIKELNSNQIAEILPHRYPFALVDKITDYEPGKWAKGIKCVSTNEMHFMGHFPKEHIMPGVLIVEALAQVGAIALLSLDENRGKIAYFAGIKRCRFKKKVLPGDLLELKCELTQSKASIGYGRAVAKVDGKVAVLAELTFALGD